MEDPGAERGIGGAGKKWIYCMRGMGRKVSLVTRVEVPSGEESVRQFQYTNLRSAFRAVCALAESGDTRDLLKSSSSTQSFENGSLQPQPSPSLICHLHSFIPLQQSR